MAQSGASIWNKLSIPPIVVWCVVVHTYPPVTWTHPPSITVHVAPFASPSCSLGWVTSSRSYGHRNCWGWPHCTRRETYPWNKIVGKVYYRCQQLNVWGSRHDSYARIAVLIYRPLYARLYINDYCDWKNIKNNWRTSKYEIDNIKIYSFRCTTNIQHFFPIVATSTTIFE